MERLKRVRKQRTVSAVLRLTVAVIVAIGLLAFFWVSLARGMDAGVDNQNVMLCKSAEKSGNVEWLEKCEHYYATGEYEYLRGL